MQALFIHTLYQQSHVQANVSIARLIVDAVDNMNSPLPKDPKTGVVYFSEAKLALPPTPTNIGPITYSYHTALDGFDPALRLAQNNDIQSAKSPVLAAQASLDKTFEGVPKLQACARGVLITYNQKDVQHAAGSKVLSDGKTVYFSTEPLCPSESLLTYAKTIDSYN